MATRSADRAVDGNTNPDISADSCSHTLNNDDSNPWWAVDLESSQTVKTVTLYNRECPGCCKLFGYVA